MLSKEELCSVSFQSLWPTQLEIKILLNFGKWVS